MKQRWVWSALLALALVVIAFNPGMWSNMAFAQGPKPTPPKPKAPSANVGSAFTYQGQLKKNGVLVNGSCYLQFDLYADAGAVNHVVGPVFAFPYPVNVTNGLFTAQVDFGSGAIQGDARWLLTYVKCGSDSGFTGLSLQQLMPAPMALALPGLYTQQNGTSPNIIGGYSGNTVDNGAHAVTISGGGESSNINHVSASWGTIGGGANNTIPITGTGATIGGGISNNASGNESTVAGGADNTASRVYSTVGGGVLNNAIGDGATIGGGWSNTASGIGATIGGGNAISVTGWLATVGGGCCNSASGTGAFVGGGGLDGINYSGNIAQGNASVIGGGIGNTVVASYTTIGGGISNTVSVNGSYATIGGGYHNSASDYVATVSGGADNKATGEYATVSGGEINTASGFISTVPGGFNAAATRYGEMAYASGGFAYIGDAQTSLYVLRNTTTDATQTELFLDGVTQRITIASNRTLSFEILVTARSSVGESAGYRIWGAIKNVGGTTTLVGASGQILGEDDSAWDAVAAADDANDALVVKVTGATSKTIRWVAVARTAEVAY